MDPLDPLDARQIVVEYARMLEGDLTENRHPARVDSLPYAKPIIKTAIRTSVKHLAGSGQLTDELREYLENAYVYLADYLDGELVDLLKEYRQSAESLTREPQAVQDKTQTAAWRTVAQAASLAAEVARGAALDAETLRTEFQSFLASPSEVTQDVAP